MSNGYPVAGVAVSPEVVARFGAGMRYFNTLGGSSVAVAAAQATFDMLCDVRLQENAARMGQRLMDGLSEIRQSDAHIADVRGSGLYIGVEFAVAARDHVPDSATALSVVDGLRARRILISATGPGANVLKIRPPVVFSESDCDRLLEGMRATLAAVPQ